MEVIINRAIYPTVVSIEVATQIALEYERRKLITNADIGQDMKAAIEAVMKADHPHPARGEK
jgi:predicted metal-dependent TIM-barrel fold hydrolase